MKEYDLPVGWKYVSLADIANVINGVSFKPNDIKKEGIRILRSGNIQSGYLVLKDDDVFLDNTYYNRDNTLQYLDNCITASTGSIDVLGKCGTVFEEIHNCQIGAFMRLVRSKSKDDALYISFILHSPLYYQYIRRLSKNGTSINNINNSHLEEFKFPLPPKNVKEEISKWYYSLEKKIALNTRMNAELEAMAKQLYDYWFVQFDFPDENGKPYKSSGGKMVYNPTLKREIPAGWENKTLGEISKTPKESIAPFDTPNKIFKHYSIPAYDIYGSYSLDRGDEIQSSKFVVHNGQILAPKLNPWYNRIILVNSDENAICSTEYVILEPKEDYVRGFIFYTVKTDGFITFCSKGSTGTSHSQRRVPPEILRGFSFPFNADVVSDFTKCVMSQINILNRNLEQNRQLSILRDSLLPMLMNGQVTVE